MLQEMQFIKNAIYTTSLEGQFFKILMLPMMLTVNYVRFGTNGKLDGTARQVYIGIVIKTHQNTVCPH